MQTKKPLVVFAHGKESGPWGNKIKHLAGVAEGLGFAVNSPDYSYTYDPQKRVTQLLELAPASPHLVLVGSSMGGYVSAMACERLRPKALFLMAPAFYFAEFNEEPAHCPDDTVVVHGWEDDVVPADRAIRFAKSRSATLHLVKDGHSLANSLEFLGARLEEQLRRVISG